jgi:hypothetical protein
MDDVGRRILDHLAAVAAERDARTNLPALDQRVQAVKAYQHARLARTHADLLADPHTAPAARFFLDELYGPRDFTARDAQFARVVAALVRLFPGDLASIVERVAALHAVSERLDTAMAQALPALQIDPAAYAQAWRAVGRAAEREWQISRVVDIGLALEAHAKRRLLRQTLHWMRGAAHAAGLAELQAFLESGLEAFAALPSAAQFLETVSRRERELAAALYAGHELAMC